MAERDYIEELKRLSSWKDLSALEKICESIESDSTDEIETRCKFETAIQICGMDIMFGSTIFKHYLDFEVEEHADLIETEYSLTALKESKERIIHIIHRQLGLPLVGNEIALQDISLNVLSECFSESDEKLINPKLIQSKYQASIEKRAARMIYEEKLFPDDENIEDINNNSNSNFTQNKLDIWRAYIKFELSEKEFSRAQRLYDRALIQLLECSELYLDYIEFAVKTVKNWTVVESIGDRILKNRTCCEGVKSQPLMWQYYLLSIEINNRSSSSLLLSDESILVSTSTTSTTDDNGTNIISPIFPSSISTETAAVESSSANNANSNSNYKATAFEKLKSVVYQAICVPNLPSPDDYLDIQFYPCDYLCRQLRALMTEWNTIVSNDHNSDMNTSTTSNSSSGINNSSSQLINKKNIVISKFRAEMATCLTDVLNMLTVYYSDWAAGWLRYYKYAVYVEELISQFLSISSINSSNNNGSRSNRGDEYDTHVNKTNIYISNKISDDTDQPMSFSSTKTSHKKATKNSSKTTSISSSSSSSNTISQEQQNGRNIWEQAIAKYGIYSFIWLEYIHWIKTCSTTTPALTSTSSAANIPNTTVIATAPTVSSSSGSISNNQSISSSYLQNQHQQIARCLKLYKRAVAAVTDDSTVELAKEWLQFARQRGSVDDVVFTLSQTQKLLYTPPVPAIISSAQTTPLEITTNNSAVSDKTKSKSKNTTVETAAVDHSNNSNSRKRTVADVEDDNTNQHHQLQIQQEPIDQSDTEVVHTKKKAKSVSFNDDDHDINNSTSSTKKEKPATIILSNGTNSNQPTVSSSATTFTSSSSRAGLGMKSSSSATTTTNTAAEVTVPLLTGYKVLMKNLPFTADEEDIKYHFVIFFSELDSSAPSLTLEQQFQQQQLQQQKQDEEEEKVRMNDANSDNRDVITTISTDDDNNNKININSVNNNVIIKNVHIILSKAGKSRGLAIVEFTHLKHYQQALQLHNLPFHMKNSKDDTSTSAVSMNKNKIHRPVSIEPLTRQCLEINYLTYLLGSDESSVNTNTTSVLTSSSNNSNNIASNNKSNATATTASTAVHHPTTVFVSKFASSVTQTQLKEIFSVCGDILEARVAVDKKTGESKCHGLVQFTSEAGKKAALAMNKHIFDGCAISVLPSKFSAIVESTNTASSTNNTGANNATSTTDSTSSKNVGETTQSSKPNKYIAATTTTSTAGGASNKPKSKSKLSLDSSSSSTSVLSFKPRTFNKK